MGACRPHRLCGNPLLTRHAPTVRSDSPSKGHEMGTDFDQRYADEQLARSQSSIRRTIKEAYLRSALREISGSTVDFGCGAGQLLERLPTGSMGLEVNPALISILKKKGLNAAFYDALGDNFGLGPVVPGRFQTFLASHVLEHFDDAAGALRKLADTCERKGISRIVCIVPGWKGFLSDATHRTFVSPSYVREQKLQKMGSFTLATTRFFPINAEGFGRFFIYNECVFVWNHE